MVTAGHGSPDPVDEIMPPYVSRRFAEPQQATGHPEDPVPPARPGRRALAVQERLGAQAVWRPGRAGRVQESRRHPARRRPGHWLGRGTGPRPHRRSAAGFRSVGRRRVADVRRDPGLGHDPPVIGVPLLLRVARLRPVTGARRIACFAKVRVVRRQRSITGAAGVLSFRPVSGRRVTSRWRIIRFGRIFRYRVTRLPRITRLRRIISLRPRRVTRPGRISLAVGRPRRLWVACRTPAGPRPVRVSLGRLVRARGTGRVGVTWASAPAVGRETVSAGVIAEHLRCVVIRAHGSFP